MDILFLGGVFPKDEESIIYSKSIGVIQFAANALQWNIINGLDACNDKPISILNSIFIGSYPKFYKDIYVKSNVWNHTVGAKDRNVGFLNIFGIKQIWRGLAISKLSAAWAKNKDQGKKVILIYSMNTPFIYAAVKAKKKNPDVKICLICPDLPEFMNPGIEKKAIFNILKLVDRKVMNYLLNKVDSFVLLSKHMTERININNRPWIVMEGVVNLEESKSITKNYDDIDSKKIVLYTGTLNKAYGIMELLEAFSIIKEPNINLWICGAGEAQLDVEELEKKNPRVKYFGQVDREYAIKLQKKASLLVNPRNDKGEYTKYSFPSKIIEYMASGTPALMYSLPGIPDEYYEHIYIIDGDSPVDIANSITRICKKSHEELNLVGENAKKFVLTNKNHVIQAQRIVDLINSLD